MTPKKYKISLDMLRMAARNAKGRNFNPCYSQIERITNAMQAADYNIRPLYKYIKEAEDCYRQADLDKSKKGRASTLYYLSQYLEQQKFKTK
jgi:hypothetical protein